MDIAECAEKIRALERALEAEVEVEKRHCISDQIYDAYTDFQAATQAGTNGRGGMRVRNLYFSASGDKKTIQRAIDSYVRGSGK